MKIREYKDGLAFLQDDEVYEIAFYSNITDRITYCQHNGYKDWIAIGCVELSFEDNLKIVEEVRRYKNMKDICIDYCESTICDGCKYKDSSDVEREKAIEEITILDINKSLVSNMDNTFGLVGRSGHRLP